MADFATWVTAAWQELGFVDDDEFLEAYRANRQESSDTALEFSVIGIPITELVNDSDGLWIGSHSDLLRTLNARASEQQRKDPDWPRSERHLSAGLPRLDANLDAAGYSVKRLGKDAKTRRGIVRIEAKKRATVVEFHQGPQQSEEVAAASTAND